MTDLARRAELELAPMVIDVPVTHSPLDDDPPCWSPLEDTVLRWSPASTREIAASIDRAKRRRWWLW